MKCVLLTNKISPHIPYKRFEKKNMNKKRNEKVWSYKNVGNLLQNVEKIIVFFAKKMLLEHWSLLPITR